MDSLLSILSMFFWFIVILIPLVTIHEIGHLLFARLFGVKVPEFGIGMPPRWVHKKWLGIVWSLNYLPLGGFVRIYGDNDAIDQASDEAIKDPVLAKENYVKNRFVEILTNRELEFFLEANNIEFDDEWRNFEKTFLTKKEKDEEFKKLEPLANQLETLIEWEFQTALKSSETFFSKNIIQKIIILLGGVTFNLLAAFILFFIVVTTATPTAPMFPDEIGQLTPQNVSVVSEAKEITVVQVDLDSPAYKAGIRNNFEILEIGGKQSSEFRNRDQFTQVIQNAGENGVPVTFRNPQSGEVKTATIESKKVSDRYLIGVSGFGRMVSVKANDFGTGVTMAFNSTTGWFTTQLSLVGDIFTSWLPNAKNPNAADSVGGPIAVSKVGGYIFNNYGLAGILNLIAIISVGLAVFNLLPIPALDGGRILIVLLSKIFGKRNRNLEAAVINITFIAMLGLALVIAFKDIRDVFGGKYG